MYMYIIFALAVVIFQKTYGSCVFSVEPVTTTVTIGETAEFGCRCEGSDSTPSWYINGDLYPASELPYPYDYISQISSLVVYDVTLALNQTTIRCRVNSQFSSEGTLFVIEKETTSSRVFSSYILIKTTSKSMNHLLSLPTFVGMNYTATHTTDPGMSSFSTNIQQNVTSFILDSCLKCNQSLEPSTIVIVLASVGIISTILIASATIPFFIIWCRRFHHLKNKQNSDPHIYEEAMPNPNEPIYELVGPDSKDINLEANEAYTDHMMMDSNAAYEISPAGVQLQADV